MTSAHPSEKRPYHPAWHLVPLLGGLIDLPWGIFVKLLGIFWRPALPMRCDTPRRRRRGLTLVLGGIEGPSTFSRDIVCGILRSGYRGSVVRFDWNAGIPFWRSLVNLVSREHQARQVKRLVAAIREYKRGRPDAPVCLVAQSGGCWIVVRALEDLPDGVTVDTAILLAPSISPAYDHRKASARCSSALISVGAMGDFVFLGLGTLLLGTSDRVFTPSAGLMGWHHRADGFRETRWHADWAKYGYIGNHTTTSAPRFMAAVIGPQLPWRDCGAPGRPLKRRNRL